jgi:molecular chaperone DnaK (HSP70)
MVEQTNDKPCIGIDLGTYNSVVGIWSEDEV